MNPYLLLAIVIASFGSGWIVEYKFHLADEAVAAYQQLTNAQMGQSQIIKNQQVIQKEINDAKPKDPCLTQLVPTNINKRLR